MTRERSRSDVGLRVLDEADWAAVVAAELAARLRARPDMRLCLPTGDTPVPLYDAVVAAERAGALSFDRATLVMLDEWLGLPPGDAARCDVRIRRDLLDRLAAPPASFVAVAADGTDPEEAARRHDLAARGLDLAVVGLGMNGHVGFNEPGSGPDAPTRVVALAQPTLEAARERYGASAVPTAGITIGLGRIGEADECWLLVRGRHKAEVLRRVLEGPETSDWPASYLRRHPRLTVFADDGAASLLTSRGGRAAG